MVRKSTLDKRNNKFYCEFLFTGSRDGDLGNVRTSLWLNDINDLLYYITKFSNRNIQELIIWDSILPNERKVPEVNKIICHIRVYEECGHLRIAFDRNESKFYSLKVNTGSIATKVWDFLKEVLCIG